MGKSKFIRHLFYAQYENSEVFTPHTLEGSISKYQYSGYSAREHTMTVADEFDWRKMNIDH